MFRYLKANGSKPIQMRTLSADMKRGTPVTVDYANDEVDKASTTGGIGFVDIPMNADGLNAVYSPTDGSFEDLKEGTKALYVPTYVGERYATTELTVGNLEVGNYLKTASGKFVSAANSEVSEWVYGDVYSDPTGLTMYAVEKIPAHTVVTYAVTYNKNDVGASGTITDAKSPYQSGNTVVVKPVTGITAPTGKVLDVWCTKEDKTTEGAITYNPGDTFTVTSATTLYAIWKDAPAE